MKTRNGFVSNSSSSSFAIAVNPEDTKHCPMKIEVDLSKYASETIKSEADLKTYFEQYKYGKKDLNEYQQERYNGMLRLLEEGKAILVGSFSTDGYDSMEASLAHMGLKDLEPQVPMEILEGAEGGY